MFVYVSLFSHSAPVIFSGTVPSAISHRPRIRRLLSPEKSSFPSPEPMGPARPHGPARSVFPPPAAGSRGRQWRVPLPLPGAPRHPQADLPPGFPLCTRGGLGPRSPPPFPLVRSIGPPQRRWKTHGSPGGMPPFRGGKSGFRSGSGQAPGTGTHTHPAGPLPPGLPSEAAAPLPRDPSPSLPQTLVGDGRS